MFFLLVRTYKTTMHVGIGTYFIHDKNHTKGRKYDKNVTITIRIVAG